MSRQETRAERQNRTKRTLARLLSLAAMVERSAFQFTFIRFFLLWLLRPAEAKIFEHVCVMANDAGLPDLPDEFGLCDDPEVADSAQEALLLAQRLRALANIYMLLDALHWANRFEQDSILRAHYRRLWRESGQDAEIAARLKWAAGAAASGFGRPEVRPAHTWVAAAGSPDLKRQDAGRRALHFPA